MSNQSLRKAAQQALQWIRRGNPDLAHEVLFEALAQAGDDDLGLMASLQDILDGTDTGEGVSPEPWEGLRRKVLKLMRPDDKAQPVATVDQSGPMLAVNWLSVDKALQLPHGAKLYTASQPPAEQGAELSDSELYKMACLSLGNVPAARYRKDLLGLMRKVIAADRAARGGAAC